LTKLLPAFIEIRLILADMKKLSLFCLAACLTLCASAQKVYFLYLQSEDQSPFYVRMGDKIHSSANAGFLILPNLADGTYTFGLGFAKSTLPEAKFSVSISENDKGYIIKNFEDGLSLFDFRDMSLVKSNSVPRDNTVYETKKDNFSSILSKAADDPSLLKVPVAKKEEAPKEKAQQAEVITAKVEEKAPEKPVETAPAASTLPEETNGSAVKEGAAAGSTVITETAKKPTAINTPPPAEEKGETTLQDIAFRPSIIKRYSESSTTEGFGVIYFDSWQGSVDTIRILIPSSKVKVVADTETASSTEIQPMIEKHDLPKEDPKTVAAAGTIKEEPAKAARTSTSCKSLASEKDFLKLRKKMAAKDYEEGMLDEARKEFRARCYTVEQLRYLSTLFLTSASKYQFFDAAYAYATDKGNFASLGSEIKDEHYSKRFKALIGE
jgi:hypothetical protein